MADDISRFDPNYEKSIQAVSTADDETSLNLKADPTDDNRLLVQSNLISIGGQVSTVNSSSTPLLADAVFTGTAVDVLNVASIVVGVFSNVASATDGLSVQFSADGTNWDNIDVFTIPANTGKTFSFQPALRYMRVVYTNGGSDQTTFRLQTTFRTSYVKSSSHRIQDAIVDEDDAELMKSVITGKTAAGAFINFGATNNGNFKISLEETNGYEPQDFEAGPVTVGTTAVELTFTGQTKTMMIQADHDNTGSIYVGKSNVTNAGANAMTRLMAGESLTITLNDATNAIYAVATVASQTVYKMSLIQ